MQWYNSARLGYDVPYLRESYPVASACRELCLPGFGKNSAEDRKGIRFCRCCSVPDGKIVSGGLCSMVKTERTCLRSLAEFWHSLALTVHYLTGRRRTVSRHAACLLSGATISPVNTEDML